MVCSADNFCLLHFHRRFSAIVAFAGHFLRFLGDQYSHTGGKENFFNLWTRSGEDGYLINDWEVRSILSNFKSFDWSNCVFCFCVYLNDLGLQRKWINPKLRWWWWFHHPHSIRHTRLLSYWRSKKLEAEILIHINNSQLLTPLEVWSKACFASKRRWKASSYSSSFVRFAKGSFFPGEKQKIWNLRISVYLFSSCRLVNNRRSYSFTMSCWCCSCRVAAPVNASAFSASAHVTSPVVSSTVFSASDTCLQTLGNLETHPKTGSLLSLCFQWNSSYTKDSLCNYRGVTFCYYHNWHLSAWDCHTSKTHWAGYEATVILSSTLISQASVSPPRVVNEQGNLLPHSPWDLGFIYTYFRGNSDMQTIKNVKDRVG